VIEEKCREVHAVMRDKVWGALDSLGRRWNGEILAAGVVAWGRQD
jgi:hypothetical protein